MARQFIVGRGRPRRWRACTACGGRGAASPSTCWARRRSPPAEADPYAKRVGELLAALVAATAGWAPDATSSVTTSARCPESTSASSPPPWVPVLAPHARADGLAQAKHRLRPILRQAQAGGAFIHLDAEHYDVKDLTLRLVRELLSEPEFAEMEAGVVIQAYLKDARRDLAELIDLSATRSKPLTVRLVKGAYWDAETVHAQAEGWPVPVFGRKEQTDANYERCVGLLHEATARCGPRSAATTSARSATRWPTPGNGDPRQWLRAAAPLRHGRAHPAAIRSLGLRLRVYAPVGELVPGMAYLVRRLLENTANECFVRHRFAEGRTLDELLAPPGVDVAARPRSRTVRRRPTDPAAPGPYSPEPVAEWRRAERPEPTSARAVVRAGKQAVRLEVPAVIDGRPLSTEAHHRLGRPGRPGPDGGDLGRCGRDEAEAAVAAARRAWPGWRRTPARERAAVLFRAAAWMRDRRNELATLEVFEAGKPWDEADGDVCEAIDFCEYYGREMLRLDRGGAGAVAAG